MHSWYLNSSKPSKINNTRSGLSKICCKTSLSMLPSEYKRLNNCLRDIFSIVSVLNHLNWNTNRCWKILSLSRKRSLLLQSRDNFVQSRDFPMPGRPTTRILRGSRVSSFGRKSSSTFFMAIDPYWGFKYISNISCLFNKSANSLRALPL